MIPGSVIEHLNRKYNVPNAVVENIDTTTIIGINWLKVAAILTRDVINDCLHEDEVQE